MKANVVPVLGNWYKHLDLDHEFQVVAYDETDGVVEIQYYDGDVEALELDDWNKMALEHIEPPAEWVRSMDDFESDDIGYTEADMIDEDWGEDLNEWNEERSGRVDD